LKTLEQLCDRFNALSGICLRIEAADRLFKFDRAREKPTGGLAKKACKSVEEEENHEKALAGSGQEIKWEVPN